MANLRSKLKNKKGNAEEKSHLETLREMAHARYDLYIPLSGSPRSLGIGRARSAGTELMASPVMLEDVAQSEQRIDALLHEVAQLMSADASPLSSPVQSLTLDGNGNRSVEQADDLDTSTEDESMALLSELPMDERTAEDGHDSDESYQQLFDEETQRRRQRREAVAIGTLEDGLEIYEPISEVEDVREMTANELNQSLRGLGDQVQGLLNTLEQIQPRP